MKMFVRNMVVRPVFLAVICSSVASCASMETTGSAAIPAQEAAVVPAAAGDPVAAYATGAVRGATGVVKMASGSQARVHVGAEYVSAAGDRCKRVILTDTSLRKTQVSAVCLTDRGWNTVVGL